MRFADRPGVTVPADIRLALPSADNRLPSKALGAAGGGRIAVDAEDTDGLTSIEDIFTFESSGIDLVLLKDLRLFVAQGSEQEGRNFTGAR